MSHRGGLRTRTRGDVDADP